MAASLHDRRIEQSVMLQQIEDVLRHGQPEDPPAYTLILGAGASFGTVPTAKQMLGIPYNGVVHEDSIPVFLHQRAYRATENSESPLNVVKSFWKRFEQANGDLFRKSTTTGGTQSAPITLSDTGYPNGRSVAEAYKAIFDQRRTAGINTPAGAREYLRAITLKRRGEPTRLNGTHFFLASLLSLQRRAQEADEKGKLYYVGRRDFARTIFTTNFDPLLQVSLQLFQLLYYMTDRPELLAVDGLHTDDHPALHLFYAHGSVHRPFLANTDDEIAHLHANARDLAGYLGRHGVIVLGYSGWDDCLLRAMQQTSSFANNLYWLARGEDSLSPEVQKFLCSRPNAYWVPITDGGVFMECLHRKLCPAVPYTELLQNPIPFVQRRLERVALSDIGPTSISLNVGGSTEEDTSAAGATEQSPSPEQFRLQVVDLLKYSAQHFSELAPDSKPQLLLAQLALRADLAYAEQQWKTASTLYTQIITQGAALPDRKSMAFFRRGICYDQQSKTAEAIADYTCVIDLAGAPAEQVAMALVNRGFRYGQQGKTAEEIADYTRVIDLAGAPAEQVAKAHVNRGFRYGQQGKTAEAIADYTCVIDLAGAPAEQVARSLFNRGNRYSRQGKTAEAIADYTRVIDLAGAPAEQVAKALFNRGNRYGQQDKTAEAIADYTRVIDLAGAPAEQVAKAHVNRGFRYGQQGKTAEAIADYTCVIDLAGAPAEQVAMALVNRGVCYGQQDKTAEEIADYTCVIDLTGAPAEQVAKAHVNRGFRYGQQGKTAEAIADYTRVIDLAGAPAEQVAKALFNRGNRYGQQGKTAEAIADYTRVIDLAGAPAEQVERARERLAFIQNTQHQNGSMDEKGQKEAATKRTASRARSRKAPSAGKRTSKGDGKVSANAKIPKRTKRNVKE